MKFRFFSILFAILIVGTQSFSQSKDYNLSTRVERYVLDLKVDSYDEMMLRDACLYHINRELTKNGARALIPDETLQEVAQIFANYIAKTDDLRC